MSTTAPTVYALYVEKQMVGKRLKGSKIKVMWKFCTEPDLKTQEVVILHSVMSGKRVIKLNGNVVAQSKKLKSGLFEQNFRDMHDRLDLTVQVRDGFEGFSYDLLTDGRLFHKNKNISISKMEAMRESRKSGEISAPDSLASNATPTTTMTERISYRNFTKHDSSTLDAVPNVLPSNQEQPKPRADSLDLLGMDTPAPSPAYTPYPPQPQGYIQQNPQTFQAIPVSNEPQHVVADGWQSSQRPPAQVQKIRETTKKKDPFEDLFDMSSR